MFDWIDSKLVMSSISLIVTAYFWLIKSRKEQPNLEFHQLSDYRAICRTHPSKTNVKRLIVQQLDTGGVLIVNHSTRQNSVVLFDCIIKTAQGKKIFGDWGFGGDDKPPWNISPESSIAFSPACFFDVPDDYEVPNDLEFTMIFHTASGKTFSETFALKAPRRSMVASEDKQAA